MVGLEAESIIALTPCGDTLNRIVTEGSVTETPAYDLIPGYLAANKGSITGASTTLKFSIRPSAFGMPITEVDWLAGIDFSDGASPVAVAKADSFN